ncbi:MAG: DUF996 domain-containing protein [Bacteroidales bacterium]
MKKDAVLLGRIGILLPAALVVPLLNNLAGIGLIVLLLLSHYYFAKVYEKPLIFRAALAGYMLHVILSAVFIFFVFKSLLSQEADSLVAGFKQLSEGFFGARIFPGSIQIVFLIIALVIGFVLIYISLRSLSKATDVKYFNIAGLLYLIGSAGLLIYYIGIIVMLAGWIFHIIAYFSVKPEREMQNEAV